ncbi:MAG: helix-turn-helix transcriptional regulator [Pseudomonadota bacterium]
MEEQTPQSQNEIGKILKNYLDNFQKRNPAFSLRALSKKCGVNPGYLSQVFNGKKIPTQQFLEKLADSLKLSTEERLKLKKMIIIKKFREESQGLVKIAEDADCQLA